MTANALSLRHMLLILLVWSMAAPAEQALAFKILEPSDHSVLKSGKTVTAKVDLGRDAGVVRVRYYWYPQYAETLVEQEETTSPGTQEKIADDRYWQKDFAVGGHIVALPFLSSTAQHAPPFGGALRVPTDAIGKMRLLAVAEVSRGRLGTRSVFDEIEVMVEPEAALQTVDFETEKPLRLGRTGQLATYGQPDTMGKVFELPVVGVFADGVTRPLTDPSAGTTYKSSNEKVVVVHQQYGLLQIVGNGQTTLTATNRGKSAELDVTVDVGEEPNLGPIADAGQSQTVKAGRKVKLNGLKSRDAEGEALFYQWSQVRGSKVPLLDLNMPEASFVAPTVSEKRLLRFKLRVTDKKGADSLPAYVDVWVEP
jgi:hypothetical protein